MHCAIHAGALFYCLLCVWVGSLENQFVKTPIQKSSFIWNRKTFFFCFGLQPNPASPQPILANPSLP